MCQEKREMHKQIVSYEVRHPHIAASGEALWHGSWQDVFLAPAFSGQLRHSFPVSGVATPMRARRLLEIISSTHENRVNDTHHCRHHQL